MCSLKDFLHLEYLSSLIRSANLIFYYQECRHLYGQLPIQKGILKFHDEEISSFFFCSTDYIYLILPCHICCPFESTEQFIVFIVNDCTKALCKRDYFHIGLHFAFYLATIKMVARKNQKEVKVFLVLHRLRRSTPWFFERPSLTAGRCRWNCRAFPVLRVLSHCGLASSGIHLPPCPVCR